ncbi:hypothetical protein [Roseibium polysiphoniae]|uniref:hypothetical protein n=1 Tax=Roseibium polysiphoniae TaxID=2571221 RepID=UPI003297A423
MKKFISLSNTALIYLMVLCQSQALAEATNVVCTIEYTHDFEQPARSGATTGEFSLAISDQGVQSITNLACQNLSVLAFNDSEIEFKCLTNLNLVFQTATMTTISRFSGNFEQLYGAGPSDHLKFGLMHTGRCVVVTKRF